MIETVMSFALGFLLASLAGLLMLPTLNRRATRLARRRLDGLFPLSMQEIAAERDALRAEFAIAQRRMERKVEAARAGRQTDMKAVGERLLEIAALQHEVEDREAMLIARKAEIDEALARIAGLDRDLSTSRAEGAAGLAALTALEEAHREMLSDLKTVRRERDSARIDLRGALAREEIAPPVSSPAASPIPTEGEETVGTVAAERAALIEALDGLRARHDTVARERDALQASLKVAETALAEALAGDGDRDRDRARDEAELRSRIAEVADALTRRDRLPSVGTFPLPAAARS